MSSIMMENTHFNNGKEGCVVWITGLSGAGKTTIAKEVQKQLLDQDIRSILLDGDLMREAMQDPHHGYDQDSRLMGAYRYSRFGKLLSSQGFHVLIATVSMFHEVRKWNRENLPNYFEIYIQANEQTRRDRDPKGLYAQHDSGSINHLSGLDQTFESPERPDMVIDNNSGAPAPQEQVQRIIDCLRSHL